MPGGLSEVPGRRQRWQEHSKRHAVSLANEAEGVAPLPSDLPCHLGHQPSEPQGHDHGSAMTREGTDNVCQQGSDVTERHIACRYLATVTNWTA